MLAHDVTFASLGVPAPLVAVLDGTGITVAVPDPGGDAARRAGRPRHPRAGADRLRQDAGLLPADGRPAGGRPDRGGPAARAGAGADPGTGDSGAGGPDAARARDGAAGRDHLRRCLAAPAGSRAQPPYGHRRRLPGPSRGPDRAGVLRPRRRRGHRHRRGRSDGRPGIPPDRPAAARGDARRRAADAVLRHPGQRDRRARPAFPHRPRAALGGRELLPRRYRAPRDHDQPGAPARRPRRAGRRRQAIAGLHPDQARRGAARPPAHRRRASPPPNCTATSLRARGHATSPRSAPGPCVSWSLPTSPPAASTWMASTW